MLGTMSDFRPSDEPARGRVRAGLWCPCLGLGGAEAWQLALAKAVDPARVTWRGAAVFEGSGPSNDQVVESLAAIMPIGYGLGAAWALATTTDVILAWAVADFARIRRGLARPPRIIMVSHLPGEIPWGGPTVEQLAAVDQLSAVSELAVDAIPPHLRDRTRVIWNAVDAHHLKVRRDRAAMRASWGIRQDVPVAGFLGRLAPEKDPDAMLRLGRALPEPWHVVIVGEGWHHTRLAERIRNEDLDRVRLTGGDMAAGDVLNAIDTLIVPSLYESFGLTLCEGLWMGLPVISTGSGLAKMIPSLTRTIPIRATGDEIAAAILADRDDPDGTRDRVTRAQAFALDRLNSDRFGREWTDLIVEMGNDHD